MMQYLGSIEQRTNEILQQYAAIQQMSDVAAGGGGGGGAAAAAAAIPWWYLPHVWRGACLSLHTLAGLPCAKPLSACVNRSARG